MSDSNRARLSFVEETTLGTTPGSPAMKTVRYTGETLNFNVVNTVSEEIRSDRQVPDLIQTGAATQGDVNIELSYPLHGTFISVALEAALFGAWQNTNQRYNAVADTDITDVASGTGTVTVSNGTAFAANDVCKLEGFTNAPNNGVFVATGGSATTAVFGAGAGMSNEAAPPLGALIKKVGVQGASGDITATASGLGSTTLNWTTHGLQVGQWIKVGGATAGTQFATAANNGYARITAIAASALTLDNLPSGWGVDSGAGKTIQVFFSDVLINGVTPKSVTIEKAFLDQTVPSYLVYTGMMPGSLSLSLSSGQLGTGSLSYVGMGHSAGTVTLGSPQAASVENVLSASASVGRIAENNAAVVSPNFIRSMTINVQNNLRTQNAVGSLSPVGVGTGRCDITGQMETYFGDLTLYNKCRNAQATSVNVRFSDAASLRALIFDLRAIEFESARVTAERGNTDVMANMGYRAKRDPTTNSQMMICRFNYTGA